MLVRRLRKRAFANECEQTRAVLASKLTGSPQLDVVISGDAQDVQAFSLAWNSVQARLKQAGLSNSMAGIRVTVQDEGRYTARFWKGKLAVNLSKFAKNSLAPELLAQELGRRFWATNLTEAQRKKLAGTYKDPEAHFAKVFRTKLFGKPKGERWEGVQL